MLIEMYTLKYLLLFSGLRGVNQVEMIKESTK